MSLVNTTGYTWVDGEVITAAKLNLAAVPTIADGQAGVFGSITGTSGALAGLTGLAIRDTSAAFDVTIAATSSTALAAGRTLTIDLKNASRTLKLTGNVTGDQDVSTTASPTFVGGTFSGAVGGITTISVTTRGQINSSRTTARLCVDSAIETDQSAVSLKDTDVFSTPGNYISFLDSSGTLIGSISHNAASTVAFNTSSDARLKSALRTWSLGNSFDKIIVGSFDWKSGGTGHGVLAQSLYEIYPDAVTKGDDDPSEITKQWGVDYGKLTVPLIAEVQALRARVALLESR